MPKDPLKGAISQNVLPMEFEALERGGGPVEGVSEVLVVSMSVLGRSAKDKC
jgi:hypothetical protein